MSASPFVRLEHQLERLTADVTAQGSRILRALRHRRQRQESELHRVNHLLEARRREVDGVHRELAGLRRSLRSNAGYVSKFKKLLPADVRDRLMLLNRLERIANGTRPIIVGPWTGEVGYEVLYWIPFVRWFVEQYRIDPERVRVLSRGGPSSWYAGIGSRYADALSILLPVEFRERTGSHAWMKQDEVSAFDRHILKCDRQAVGGARAALLHPLLMFRTLKGFWGDRLSLGEILKVTSHRRLTPPAPIPGLPEKYVAVRFYFRTSFPETPENRALVARVLSSLTAHSDVVVLNPGFRIDDHHDYVANRSDRVHTIEHLLTPERNLDVQTAVIGGAQAFVGSYGGFAYLAPLLGVKCVAFYSAPTFKTSHLELAEHVFASVGGASLTVVDAAEYEVVAQVLPAAAGSMV